MEFAFGFCIVCAILITECSVDALTKIQTNKRSAQSDKERLVNVARASPLQVRSQYKELTQFENYPYRKIFNMNPHLQPVSDKRKNVARNDKYLDSLFDRNGMTYLTLPSSGENRQLNGLLNDIVALSAHLRESQPKRKRDVTDDRITFFHTDENELNSVDVKNPNVIFGFSQ